MRHRSSEERFLHFHALLRFPPSFCIAADSGHPVALHPTAVPPTRLHVKLHDYYPKTTITRHVLAKLQRLYVWSYSEGGVLPVAIRHSGNVRHNATIPRNANSLARLAHRSSYCSPLAAMGSIPSATKKTRGTATLNIPVSPRRFPPAYHAYRYFIVLL